MSTAPIDPGTEVAAQRYLADVTAAAAAVADYADALRALPQPATPADLRRIAPALAPPLARVGALQGRLGAARLADQRLDEQRARVAMELRDVLDAMRRVQLAAEAGRPTVAAMAVDDLGAATERLRAADDPPE